MTRPRLGRPPTSRDRVRFPLYLESRDLPLLHAAAKAAGIPTLTWACRLLLEAARRDTTGVHERRTARGRDTVEPQGNRAPGQAGRAGARRPLLPAPGTPHTADLQVDRDREVHRRRGRTTACRHRRTS